MTATAKHFNELESSDYWQALNRKSLLRFFLLQQLAKASLHGYEIANRIALCCDARPTDAMIYPMLKELERGEFVSFETLVINGRQRKVYSLTERGIDAYRTAATAWSNVLPQLETAVKEAGVETACCSTTVIDSSVFGE